MAIYRGLYLLDKREKGKWISKILRSNLIYGVIDKVGGRQKKDRVDSYRLKKNKIKF